MNIPIHNKKDFEKMRTIGKYTNELLNEIECFIKPNISTQEIDDFAAKFIKKNNLKSACIGYKGNGNIAFPANICTSPNYVICHGIPSKDCILKSGDIISVDVTIIKDGYHGDSCRTFGIQDISNELKNLITTTKKAMEIGINACIPGNYIGDIGHAIQTYIKTFNNKYSIVEDYCGHGIGTKFHQPPQIEHIGHPKTKALLRPGMFFTIEPMINLGSKDTKLLNDGWTVITKDYKNSAQFEHTIGITENGFEIFT